MQWNEVIGQSALSQKLRDLVQNGRLPHALLLNGKLGYGSMALAQALATYVQCRARSETDSCGQCDQCKRNATLQNPDLLLSFPTVSQGGPTTADDFYTEYTDFQSQNPYGTLTQWLRVLDADKKQANITAKECRRIIERLSLKPVAADHKVVIIWLPEYLGKEGNILLKIIEEPSPDTLIILVTENMESLLGTIRSRVQDIKVPPISTAVLEETAAQRLPLLHARSPEYAVYRGDWAEVLSASQTDLTDMDNLLKSYLNAVFRNDIDSQIEWTQTISQHSKHEVLTFLKYVQEMLYKLLRAPEDTTDSVINKLRSYDLSFEQITAWDRLLQDIYYSLRRNTLLKLTLHNLLLRSAYLVRSYELS